MPTAIKEPKDASGRDRVEKTTELSEQVLTQINVVHSTVRRWGHRARRSRQWP